MNERILIIEDDLDFAGQLKTLCESRGYRARVALTAADGLRSFRAWLPSLVLLDLKLPDGHGMRVAGDIRSEPGGDDVPIFFMSAVYRRRELFERDMALLGVDTYLPKPFSLEDLARRIGAVFAGTDLGRAIVRERLSVLKSGAGRAYAREDSVPTVLPDALSNSPSTRPGTLSDDRLPRADSARRLPRSGEMRPEIWVRILTTLFHSHSNGLVVRKRGGKKRTIYFLNGYPVWAEGPSPEEGILRFFRVEGVLDATLAERVGSDLAAGGMSLHGLLLATGKVKADDLSGLFEDWVAEEVRNTLRHAGEFEFVQTEDFAGKIPVYEVNPIPTLWEGLEESLDRRELRRSLEEVASRELGRTRNFGKMFGYIGASETLKAVGDMLEFPRTLRQIRAKFRDDPGVNLSIWFLLHAGLVAVSDSPAPTLARVSREQAEVVPGEASSDEDTSPPHNEDDGEELGGMEVEFEVRRDSVARVLARALAEKLDSEASSTEELVQRHHASRLGLDHYSFLGVSREASLEEIDAAYQVLAPRYRLRNLGPEVSDDVKGWARALLARLVAAFSELSDPSRRRAYDRLIDTELEGVARMPSEGSELTTGGSEFTASHEGRGAQAHGVGAIDLSDWVPSADNPNELRERCVRLDEVDAARLREAIQEMAAGAFLTAFGVLDSLRESHPSDVLLLADMAWCQFSMDPDDIRSVDKALEWADLGLAFEPSNVRALSVRARILCYARREEEAHASLRRLAPLLPEAEWVRFELVRRNDSLEAVEKSKGLRRFWGAQKT